MKNLAYSIRLLPLFLMFQKKGQHNKLVRGKYINFIVLFKDDACYTKQGNDNQMQ